MLPLVWDYWRFYGRIEQVRDWLIESGGSYAEKPRWQLVQASSCGREYVQKWEHLPFRSKLLVKTLHGRRVFTLRRLIIWVRRNTRVMLIESQQIHCRRDQWTACELPHRCPQVFGTSLRVDATYIGGSGYGWQCLSPVSRFSKQEHWPSRSGQLALGDSSCAALP